MRRDVITLVCTDNGNRETICDSFKREIAIGCKAGTGRRPAEGDPEDNAVAISFVNCFYELISLISDKKIGGVPQSGGIVGRGYVVWLTALRENITDGYAVPFSSSPLPPPHVSRLLVILGGGGSGGSKSSGRGNQSGGKRRRQWCWRGRRGSDDNDDDEEGDSDIKDNSSNCKTSGKLYLKVHQPSSRTPSPLFDHLALCASLNHPELPSVLPAVVPGFGSSVSAPAPSRPAINSLLISCVLLSIPLD